MNLSTGEAFSVNKWQRCYFELKSTDATCAKKASALRCILSQIQVAHAAGSISTNGAVQLTRQYSDILSGLADSQSELNNYAEDILNICSNHRNESQEWKSSFTPESLLQLECVQQIVKDSEQFKASQMSGSTMNIRNTPDARAPIDFIKSSKPEDKRQLTMSYEGHQQTGSNTSKETNYKQSVCRSYTRSGHSTKFNPALSIFGNSVKPKPTELETSKNSVEVSRPGFYKNNPNMRSFDSDVGPSNQHRSFYDSGSRPNITDTDSRNFQHKSRLFGGDQSRMPSGIKRKVNEMNRSDTVNFNPSYVSRRPSADICDEGFNEPQTKPVNNFVTARDQLSINNQKKNNRGRSGSNTGSSSTYGTSRKVLGTRRGLNSKFVPPISNKDDGNQGRGIVTGGSSNTQGDEPVDERLKNIDPKMIELVMNEVMDSGPPIHWDDIAGLEFAKETIKEIVVWPMLRPDIFYGLRGPPKGLLLFGPPGTGKTLIGKCIANQSGATFFSISASSLTSKWIGEGEKMVRALFAVSRCHQPAVIFIDEIDSLLSQRSADEHESSRRIKTEFLVQLDGATTNSEDRLLVVGATNRPHEIDEAARRRLVKRLYIPLPDSPARKQIIINLLSKQPYELNDNELSEIQKDTEGYSGADVANLCREAALGPVRCIKDIQQVSADQVRPILFKDFQAALKNVRPSVSQQDLNIYLEWNKQYGSGA